MNVRQNDVFLIRRTFAIGGVFIDVVPLDVPIFRRAAVFIRAFLRCTRRYARIRFDVAFLSARTTFVACASRTRRLVRSGYCTVLTVAGGGANRNTRRGYCIAPLVVRTRRIRRASVTSVSVRAVRRAFFALGSAIVPRTGVYANVIGAFLIGSSIGIRSTLNTGIRMSAGDTFIPARTRVRRTNVGASVSFANMSFGAIGIFSAQSGFVFIIFSGRVCSAVFHKAELVCSGNLEGRRFI